MSLRAMFSCLALLMAGVAFGQQSPAPADLPELLAYWPLATNAQNAVVDTNHGVVMGQASFRDQALVLKGTDSFEKRRGQALNRE